MLIQVHRIDENGFYLEPVLIEQGDVVNDENIITVDPPQGLYKPRWVEGEWTEGLTQDEIDKLTKPSELQPNPLADAYEAIIAQEIRLSKQEETILQLQAEIKQLKGESA